RPEIGHDVQRGVGVAVDGAGVAQLLGCGVRADLVGMQRGVDADAVLDGLEFQAEISAGQDTVGLGAAHIAQAFQLELPHQLALRAPHLEADAGDDRQDHLALARLAAASGQLGVRGGRGLHVQGGLDQVGARRRGWASGLGRRLGGGDGIGRRGLGRGRQRRARERAEQHDRAQTPFKELRWHGAWLDGDQNQLCGTMMMSPGFMSTLAEISPRLSRSFRRMLYCLPCSEPRTRMAPLPSAKSVRPPTWIMTSSKVVFWRKGTAWGLAASPTMRICSLARPWKEVTMTVTTGSRMNLDSDFSMSRERSAGLRPAAATSSTSGREMRPSGRTVTVVDRSGLRQTTTLRVSSGPIL